MIYTYSGEIKRDYTGADEVLVCRDCERLSTEHNFISSLSRKISTYTCKCRLLKSSEVVPELCCLHGTAKWELHVSGSDSEFCFEYRACLLLLLLFECFISHFRKQERQEAERSRDLTLKENSHVERK